MTVNGDVSTPAYADRVGEMELGRKKRAASNGASNGDDDTLYVDRRKVEVDALNSEYAMILFGGSAAILREGHDAFGVAEYKFMSIDAFKEWLRPRKFYTGEESIGLSALWLNDKRRRQYEGLVFAPLQEVSATYYNLWRGFAVERDARGANGCQKFLAHMADNVCNGDPEDFAWVMGWFASIFQRPTEKTGNAIVLKGAQGAGKTIVGKVMGQLLGEHYTLVSDPRYVTGRFNSHLIKSLLLQLDEATWGGDHVATGKLKDLITGEWQLIEFKGKEPVSVRNYLRLLITSNNDWVVPAGLDERRFAVFDVGEAQMQNHAYFQAIEDEMENGGYGALLEYLLTYDLSSIDLHPIPRTQALFDQKLASMTPEMSWWIDVLSTGSLPGDRAGEGVTPVKAIHEAYIEHAKQRGVQHRASDQELGTALRKYVPELKRKRKALLDLSGQHRPYCYVFPQLDVCRAAFDRAAHAARDWSDPADAWGVDAGGMSR